MNRCGDITSRFNLKFEGYVGRDAHLAFEVGRGRTNISGDVRGTLVDGRTVLEEKESNYYLVHGLSVLMEKVKGLYGGSGN